MRARRIAIAGGIAALVALAWWRWLAMTAPLVPYVDYDTQIFEQIANVPMGIGLLGQSKPLLVPLVYRAAGLDRGVVIAIQTNLAFVAWTLFTTSFVLAMRTRWTRGLAVILGAALLLAPTRIGFTASLMSESITDSLTALIAAGAIALLRHPTAPRRARIAIAAATIACALAWLLARDTSAVVTIVAAVLAIALARGWRSRRVLAGAALATALALGALATTSWNHAQLPYQRDWDERFTARRMYPLLDNLLMRAFEAIPTELRAAAEPRADVWRVCAAKPEMQPLQQWVIDHGSSAYTQWIVAHPIDRAADLFDVKWTALAGPNTTYMPGGWDRGGVPVLGRLTRNHWILGALILCSPLLLWRPRADRLRAFALCVIASGLVGIAASYFGDAAEVSRHCYVAGQQVVAGLLVALVARIDAWLAARR